MSKTKLFTFNTFFDCNYSAVIVGVRGYNRGYNIAIIFKNKLIYENDVKPIAMVQVGCYSLSIETTN